MNKSIENIRNIPIGFDRMSFDGMAIEAFIAFMKDKRNVVKDIESEIASAEFQQLINEGKVTFGMIKPNLCEAAGEKFTHYSDWEIEQLILSKIKGPLDVLLSFPFFFSESLVEEFYKGKPREFQITIAPLKQERYGILFNNRWEEFKGLLLSGPATFLLLYEESGDAINVWRAQMGHTWNVEKARLEYPNSLRGEIPKDNHNNIVHGSDSVENVKREISLILNSILSKTS